MFEFLSNLSAKKRAEAQAELDKGAANDKTTTDETDDSTGEVNAELGTAAILAAIQGVASTVSGLDARIAKLEAPAEEEKIVCEASTAWANEQVTAGYLLPYQAETHAALHSALSTLVAGAAEAGALDAVTLHTGSASGDGKSQTILEAFCAIVTNPTSEATAKAWTQSQAQTAAAKGVAAQGNKTKTTTRTEGGLKVMSNEEIKANADRAYANHGGPTFKDEE